MTVSVVTSELVVALKNPAKIAGMARAGVKERNWWS